MNWNGFFKRQIQLGTVSRIPVRADRRWIVVFLLLTAGRDASLQPLLQNVGGSVLLVLAASILFFIASFLHEFAHAVVARLEGLQVVEITLQPFGGMARFAHPPETPRA